VLGRREAGLASLGRALRVVAEEGGALDPAARVRLEANARLALGRHHAAAGEGARARALLEEAAALDPAGPIAEAARAELTAAWPAPSPS
jgi:Tfp pilus assembly protein PilF